MDDLSMDEKGKIIINVGLDIRNIDTETKKYINAFLDGAINIKKMSQERQGVK